MNIEELKKIISKHLGIDNFSEKDRDEIISRLGENIMKRASLSAFSMLSHKEQVEFSEIASSGDPEKAHAFLLSKVPNIKNLIQKEAEEELKDIKKFSKN